jgi:hypothetical protein
MFTFRIKYSRNPIIRKLVIRKSNYPEAGYPEIQLSGSWLSGNPIIRNGSLLHVNLSRILFKKCFKLPVIGTVQCHGF